MNRKGNSSSNDCLGEGSHVRRRDVRSIIQTRLQDGSGEVKLADKVIKSFHWDALHPIATNEVGATDGGILISRWPIKVGFSRQITFIDLVAIYLLHNIVLLLSLFKSFNFFEKVLIRVGLLILRRVWGIRAFRSFPHQPFRIIEEAFHLNDSAPFTRSLWLGVRSPPASHLKDKKSNKQWARQSVHSKTSVLTWSGMCKLSYYIAQWRFTNLKVWKS